MGISIEIESRLVVGNGGGGVGWEVTLNGYRVSFGGDENVLKLIVVMAGKLLNVKWGNFMVYSFISVKLLNEKTFH